MILGVTMENTLKWLNRVEHKKKKLLNKTTFSIRTLKHTCSGNILLEVPIQKIL